MSNVRTHKLLIISGVFNRNIRVAQSSCTTNNAPLELLQPGFPGLNQSDQNSLL